MAFEEPLIGIIEKQDIESLRRLIVPWDKRKYKSIYELSKETYANYSLIPSRKPLVEDIKPDIDQIVFDPSGELEHKGYDFDGIPGLINFLIGIISPESVWSNMKGHPIPNKGEAYSLPKQYVYVFADSPGMQPVIVPQLSGRRLISDDMPIMYYVKHIPEPMLGILIPYLHTVEIPDMFKLNTS